MDIEKLKNFLLAIKRDNTPQGVGNLFMLDADTDTLYACALGKGIIEFNGLNIDDLRKELKESSESEEISVIQDGKEVFLENGRTNITLEERWNKWVNQIMTNKVAGFITSKNDSDVQSAQNIAAEALDKFVYGNLNYMDEDDE